MHARLNGGNAAPAIPAPHPDAQGLVEFITDEQGVLVGLSPTWEALTGFTAARAVGTPLVQYVLPEDRAVFYKELNALLDSDDRVPQHLRLVTRSGVPRWVELRAAARVDPGAPDSDIFGALVDVESGLQPEHVLAQLDDFVETQVAEHAVAVAGAKQALDGFIHTVAHDLRAPLRAIQGYTRILQGAMEQDGTDAARDCVTRLEQTASRMAAMFDGLLRLSRMGHVPLAKSAIDCAPLIRGVVSDIMQQPMRRPVTFVIDVRCVCHADPELLRQVFANLIGNAVKYSAGRETSRVEVKARCEGSEIVFTVRDNGVGFDMAHAGKLFHVFQRLHARSQFEGCGVGLSIVRRIVERHGGRVWAEAVEGEGAAFHFSLPLHNS